MKKSSRKRRSKSKDRIIMNQFDLDELVRLAAADPYVATAAEHFIFRQKRGNSEDQRIISNLFKDHGPVCDIEGNNLTAHAYEDTISTAQLLLLYIWASEDLRNQLIEQLNAKAATQQGDLFE